MKGDAEAVRPTAVQGLGASLKRTLAKHILRAKLNAVLREPGVSLPFYPGTECVAVCAAGRGCLARLPRAVSAEGRLLTGLPRLNRVISSAHVTAPPFPARFLNVLSSAESSRWW